MDRFVQRSRRPNPQTTAVSPRKRPRLGEVKDSDSDSDSSADENSDPASVAGDDHNALVTRGRAAGGNSPESEPDVNGDGDEDAPSRPSHLTAFESSLPAVSTGKDAVEEYEMMRASQADQESQISDQDPDGASARMDNRRWVRGQSSIYVDAFNLALDTVLEDESHLFDAKEASVFSHWRSLAYEAQYL